MFGKKKNLSEANESLTLFVSMFAAAGLDIEAMSAAGESALKTEIEKLTAAAKEEGKAEATDGVESEALAAIGKALGVTDENADLAAAAGALVQERDDLKADAGAKGERVTALHGALAEAKVFATAAAASTADAAGLKKALGDRISTAAAEALALHGFESGGGPEGEVKPDATDPGVKAKSPRERRAHQLREKHGIT